MSKSTINTAITKQAESASDVKRVIERLASPEIPDVPVLSADRITLALMQFMSERRSISEAAAVLGQTEVTLRERIERDPFHAEAVILVGTRNGKPIKETTIRLLWLAEDRAARVSPNVVLGRRRQSSVKRRGRPVKDRQQNVGAA